MPSIRFLSIHPVNSRLHIPNNSQVTHLKVSQVILLKVLQVILDSRPKVILDIRPLVILASKCQVTPDNNSLIPDSNIQEDSRCLQDTPIRVCQVPCQANTPQATSSLPLTDINLHHHLKCTLDCLNTFLLQSMEARAREMYGVASTNKMDRITQWCSRNLRSRIT